MNDNTEVNHPWIKFFTAWGTVGTAGFTDALATSGNWLLGHAAQISAVFASVYTLLLITDWWWKRFWKPLLLKFGWMKGKPRPFMSSTDHTPLDPKPHHHKE